GTFTRPAGTYTFTVTDAKGCSKNTTVTVSEPQLLVASSSATAIACNGGTATVTVSATGGSAPYTGTGTFTRPAGTYIFTVADAKGCSKNTTVTISEPQLLVVSSSATAIDCSGGSAVAMVTVSATGGAAPYTGTGTFPRPPGTYTFTVADAKGCSKNTTVTVSEPLLVASSSAT